MKMQCAMCRRTTDRDAKFCPGCGAGLAVALKRKNFLTAPLVIVAAVLFLCSLCGFIRLMGSRDKNNLSDTAEVKQPFVSSASPAPASPAQALPQVSDKKTLIEEKTNREATVIAENVNLRESGVASSKVLETLPAGTTVEVLKQRGVWFQVHTTSQTGWVHGNAIRLANSNPSIESKETLNSSELTSEVPKKTSPKKTGGIDDTPSIGKQSVPAINPSGATARCADGTLSYSAHRRGTCSHHGGVAQWF